ncbi:hypothetical protein ACF0H5_010329 [Mactra antiquata]
MASGDNVEEQIGSINTESNKVSQSEGKLNDFDVDEGFYTSQTTHSPDEFVCTHKSVDEGAHECVVTVNNISVMESKSGFVDCLDGNNGDLVERNEASQQVIAENQPLDLEDTKHISHDIIDHPDEELIQSTVSSSQQGFNENSVNASIDEHLDKKMETDSENETYFDVPKDIKFCDICCAENLQMKAVTFCPECVDYLCEGCNRFHRGCKLTKDHVTLEQLPEDSNLYKQIENLMSCLQHPNMKVTYVCNDHKKNVCVTCVLEGHRKCENVQKLTDFVKAGTRETGDLLKDIESHQLLVAVHIQRRSNNIEDIQTEKEHILFCLQEQVETVIASILRKKAETEKEIRELAARHIGILKEEKNLCKEIECKIQMHQEVSKFLLENGGGNNDQILRHVIWGRNNQNQKSLAKMKTKSKHLHFIKNEHAIGFENFGEVKMYSIDDEAETLSHQINNGASPKVNIATNMDTIQEDSDTLFEASSNMPVDYKTPPPTVTKTDVASHVKTFPKNTDTSFGFSSNMSRDVRTPSPTLTKTDVASHIKTFPKNFDITFGVSSDVHDITFGVSSDVHKCQRTTSPPLTKVDVPSDASKIPKNFDTTFGILNSIPVNKSMPLSPPMVKNSILSAKSQQLLTTPQSGAVNHLLNVTKSVSPMEASHDWFDTEKNIVSPELRTSTPEVAKHLVRFALDSFVCSISKCIVLNKGTVVLIDDNNKKLKKFCDGFKNCSYMPLDSYVSDMCHLKNDEIALIYSDLHKITVYDLGKNQFVVARSICLQQNHEFKSIAADDVNERLALIYGFKFGGDSKTYDCIQIRNFQGKIICDFKLESLIGQDIEKPLTSRNFGICFTPKGLIVVGIEHGVCYIPQTTHSDNSNDLILSKAKVLYSSRGYEMLGMTDRASDIQGNIYVCSLNAGGVVHRYERSYNYRPKCIVKGIFLPMCIGFLSRKKLIVGCQNDDFVHVYDI